MLFAPWLTRFSCAECCQYVYDLKDGTRQTYTKGDEGEFPVERKGLPPPCRCGEKCLKGDPSQEREHTLTARNWRLLAAYREHRAAGPDPRDPPDDVRRWAFAIVDGVFRNWETQSVALNIARCFAGSRE